MNNYERRTFDFTVEKREAGETPRLVGHCAVYESLSEEMGFFMPFREKIARGAFDGALAKISTSHPVYCLFNHDPNYILASTITGTLRLSSDNIGLVADITPMDTPTIRDLVITPILKGDLRKMSFGFTIADGGEHETKEDGAYVRVIDKIDTLWDASPVTFPAYPDTDIGARALVGALGIEIDKLSMPEQIAIRGVSSMLSHRLPPSLLKAERERAARAARPIGMDHEWLRRDLELREREFAIRR